MATHLARLLWMPIALAGALGCGQAAQPDAEDEPICPTCTPPAGGQTGDFDAGTLHPCLQFLERIPAEEVDLAAAGIDLEAVSARMEGDFDLPLYWSIADAGSSGVVVEGLGSPTRLHASVAIAFHQFARLDEGLCNEETCRSNDGAHEVSRSECERLERLETTFSVSLRTLDEGVGFEAEATTMHSAALQYPRASALADIADVRGSLRLRPLSEGEHRARARADLYFKAEGLDGVLAIDFASTEGVRHSVRSVVRGNFPRLPPAPGGGQAAPVAESIGPSQ